jgi:dTDP-4-amino-4,6-dideoxygalactose transaminase
MAVEFMDLKRQYENHRAEIEPKVIEVMSTGVYTGGKYVLEFESDMKRYLGVKHVIGCANGTDAIVLALRACGVKAGDEVITTPFTFFATPEAIALVGAVPVFVDIKETDFNIDPGKIEEKITAKTTAIVPVDIFGNPCDIDAINAIAKKHGLKVIDDAAQAIGAELGGRKIGGLCDITTFSFHPTKNLGAYGDAGMVTTDSDELATILRALREHGAGQNGAKAREYLSGVRDELADATPVDANALYNPYKYFNYLVGYNSRLDPVQAAVLGIKLKYLDEYVATRERIARRYSHELGDVVKVPMPAPGMKGAYHVYAIRTDKKEEMGDYMASRGLSTGAFYPVPMHLQKAFEHLGYKNGSLPVVEKITSQTVCLPIYPELTDDEITEIIDGIKAFIGA